MKYFTNKQNQVFALEDADVLPVIETDDEGNEIEKPSPWVKNDWTEITEQEATAIANPPPTAEEQLSLARANRAAAYAAEADPLFFKAQRGEAEMQEWQDKVAEIRTRFPYPED
jgi:hypothetical protein